MKVLETRHYTGGKPRYNFEMHVLKHLKSILKRQQVNTKVCKFLYLIGCATMNVPIATISAEDNLQSSFNESINYLQVLILSNSPGEDYNVSAFGGRTITATGKCNAGNKERFKSNKSGGGVHSKAFDWYYTPDQWWKLTK